MKVSPSAANSASLITSISMCAALLVIDSADDPRNCGGVDIENGSQFGLVHAGCAVETPQVSDFSGGESLPVLAELLAQLPVLCLELLVFLREVFQGFVRFQQRSNLSHYRIPWPGWPRYRSSQKRARIRTRALAR